MRTTALLAAEAIGAVTGFVFGMVVMLVAPGPMERTNWVPFVLLIVGGLAARALVKRQYQNPRGNARA